MITLLQRKRWAAFLLAAGLGLSGWGVRQFTAPPQFRASARVKVDDAATELIRKEIEVIRSESVLSAATAELSLERDWSDRYADGKVLSTDEVRRLLLNCLDVRPVRGVALIDIRATSPKADEASRIANAVAAAYRNYRIEQRERSALEALKPLQEQWDSEREKISGLQEQLHRLRVELGFFYDETVQSGGDTGKLHTYYELKQQLDILQQSHQTLAKQFGTERVNRNFSGIPQVEIIQTASTPRRPLASGRDLGALLMGIGGVLIAGGVLLMKKPRPVKQIVPAPRR